MSIRRLLAWVLLVGAIVGWPVTAVTVAREEPQFILGLSWLAIILTALDGLWIAGEREHRVEEEEEQGEQT